MRPGAPASIRCLRNSGRGPWPDLLGAPGRVGVHPNALWPGGVASLPAPPEADQGDQQEHGGPEDRLAQKDKSEHDVSPQGAVAGSSLQGANPENMTVRGCGEDASWR